MRYGALFGWGIVIYAVMYLVSSGLMIYGLTAGLLGLSIKLITLVATTAIAGRMLRTATWKDAVPHSIGWAIVVASLDAIFWGPLTGWSIYASLGVWIGYVLVAIVPIIAIRFPSRKTPPPVAA